MLFEVILQSSDDGCERPFPACAWSENHRRWEWKVYGLESLVTLAEHLGIPIRIVSTEKGRDHGDLPILEIQDKE